MLSHKQLTGWAIFFAALALHAQAADLQRLDGVTLVPSRWNDGDSFKILHADKELTIRLYYIDCAESHAASATDARRVRSQTRYFGLPGHGRTTHFGRQAAAFTKKQLSQPFSVHTAFATAPGRSRKDRYYAIVTTGDGEDMGQLLIKNGLARAYGVRRTLPDGTTAAEAAARLSDTEHGAMLDRRGIWAETDSSRLVALRAAARSEVEELKQIEREAQPTGKININTAPPEELETITGVGPVTARRIMEHRPFRTPEDLGLVPGISRPILTNLLNHITFH
ncbi:MAG: helix-hairpin-helix domain-containing protein [Kiritimatiellia bacterium]|jgi:endonuclease YncB( thermonuclease family)|nr:helix-hairpin-helix domain-containing protein [Kiritimatiellia bacterium]MDP6630183.1 helix-hairpin-helix domain-containing protein [Kiritimatiellia bacterium]MDP6810729.1 helix-hairpin-helix domain-containing protein [Kiritimatiellia bacterium]MDP7023284.1 helix-hairpin-helix domain-containing protein [Kiritimatiellia bacterium]